jgi:hypothetical protein
LERSDALLDPDLAGAGNSSAYDGPISQARRTD